MRDPPRSLFTRRHRRWPPGYNEIDAASLFEAGTTHHQVAVDPATGTVVPVPGTPARVLQSFPVQVAMSTYADGGEHDPEAAWADFDWVKSNATDSAAAGTALATGTKTYNAGIRVDADGNEVENLSERAISLGKAAGVVSSVPFSHATPAAYVAHDAHRNNYHAIADDMIASDLSVVIGAGHPEYDDDNDPRPATYQYLSQTSWNALASGATGFELVEETADFEALASAEQTPERVFGVPQVASTLQQGRTGARDAEPFETPLNDVPDLATLTEGALNVLDEDEDGLFLMVEGGAIDWTGHANDLSRNIEETLAFNDAVDFRRRVGGDQLQLEGDPRRRHGRPRDRLPGRPVVRPDVDALTGTAGELPDVSWNSGSHTNGLVPVFARGAGAKEISRLADGVDPVRGDYLDNTDLADVLLEDLWAAGPGASAGNGNGGRGAKATAPGR